jgi:hypothetical protein
MACAALAGVGFDETRGILISDARLEVCFFRLHSYDWQLNNNIYILN